MDCSVSWSCVMMMCDIFLDSLDMYLDVEKKNYDHTPITGWDIAGQSQTLLPTRQISFSAKNYRIFYDLKYAKKLPHLDPFYENPHENRHEIRHENRHENRHEIRHSNRHGFLPKDLLLKMLRFFTTNSLPVEWWSIH